METQTFTIDKIVSLLAISHQQKKKSVEARLDVTNFVSSQNVATRPKTGALFQQTEYQLHKSQISALRAHQKQVIDFTEKKLIRFIKSAKDAQQKRVVSDLLKDYLSGLVAVSWKRGLPTYVKVTKEF